MRTAFSDFKADLAALVADEESIAFGTPFLRHIRAPLLGMPATGKKISIRGVQFSKFRDGKMAERDGAVQINSGCFSSLE